MTSTPKTLAPKEQRPRFVAEAVRNLQLDRHNFAWLTADYTLTDGTAAQKAFNVTTNGAFSVTANTAYEVDGRYFINVATSSPPATGHTWGVSFGGTATLSTLGTALLAESRASNVDPIQGIYGVSIQSTSVSSNTVVTVQSTTTAQNVVIGLSGRISIANAGTLIPQVQLSSTTGGTNTMKNGSFVRLHAIGHKSVTKLGIWS